MSAINTAGSVKRPLPVGPNDGKLASALEDARREFATANPKSFELYRENQRYMPGANSRSTLFYAPYPLTIAGGEHAVVWDVDGHRYRDFIAEYTAGVYGHSAPEIQRAVVEAMASGINLCGHNLYEAKLARAICERIPSIEHLRFTNSGTEANLMAITAAINFTGRTKIAVMNGGYHGGVLTFGAKPSRTTAPYDFLILDFNNTENALTLLEQNGAQLAAVLVEPMLGASGCIPAALEFMRALQDAAQRVGALLIMDEVMTSRLAGHGLQGKMHIRPDLTTLGKYIGGGMSIGAFGGREEIMAQFDPRSGALSHSGTFNNNVVTMAAGYAGLQLYTPSAADELATRGDAMRERLNRLCESRDVRLQFTGVGSAMNAHFVSGPISSPKNLESADPRLRDLLFMHMLKNGVYMAARGFIVLSMPVSDDDIEHFVRSVDQFINTYQDILPRR